MYKIYNISASLNFVETLAGKLLEEHQNNHLKLAEVMIILPNHRACRSLAEALVRLQGMHPLLLPQMRAIGDTQEDELLLSSPQLSQDILDIPPAVSVQERTLLLMKLITSRCQNFGLENISPAQACYLAQELGSLLDNVYMRELNWQNLQNIVPDEYAAHWQETLKFLNIITQYWPDILQERGVIDVQQRRNIILRKQCAAWQQNPPSQRIIIAGTTAVSKSMKQLVQTVLNLPCGEVYLAGLDKYLDDEAWNNIDENHPQFEIKELLDYLHITRSEVVDLAPPINPEREYLISEIMRPAAFTDQWRAISQNFSAESLKGIHLCETTNSRSEALSIAILIRNLLRQPEKTIALVTPNRNLARRVTAELSRWDINIDDSAGIPLRQTSWGIYILLIISALLPSATKADALSLFKSRYFSCRKSRSLVTEMVERIDKNLWRQYKDDPEARQFLNNFYQKAQEFSYLLTLPQVSFIQLLKKHIQLAEELCSTDTIEGSAILWDGEEGNIGAEFIAELLEKAELLGDINPEYYQELLNALMNGIMVRNSAKTHPRIKILGPLESRLNHYDTIIIGSCIEGVWPSFPNADAWMSRPMKRDFGLGLPEQQIGVTALDFANLLGAKDVYITYCQMIDGAQTLKSRWLMRLLTILDAAKFDVRQLYEYDFSNLNNIIDAPTPDEKNTITAPNPKPEISKRPHKLSASAFEKLLRDPYSVFAEYILRLKPLNDLNAEIKFSEFGSLVHKILDKFSKLYPAQFPQKAKEILTQMGEEAFQESGFAKENLAFWKPKFYRIIDWIISQETVYRQQIKQIWSEIHGKIIFNNTAMGNFEIYATADRIDLTKDGSYNIIDYKTGKARTIKEIKAGYAPQLPIEALIASQGGFDELPPAPINQLMYWKMDDKIIALCDDIAQVITDTQSHILEIINLFADPEVGYLSRPNPKHILEYSDYEHLARVKEWSITSEGDEN